MSNSDKKLTKNERRAAAREQARKMHEARLRREKRNRALTIGGIVVAAVAVVVVVVLIIVNSVRPPSPGPENMAADGIVIGEGLVADRTEGIPVDGEPTPTEQRDDILQIVVYQDFMCPHCGAFEQTNGPTIESLVQDGLATVEIHPLSIMDQASLGSKYSTRSANAAACMAEHAPDSFLSWNTLMFANQPEGQTQGLTDEEMLDFMGQAGADVTPELTECVNSLQFEGWVRDVGERIYENPIPYTVGEEELYALQTPTVLVNGRQYQGPNEDAAVFQQFLQSVQGELENTNGDDDGEDGDGGEEDAEESPEETESP
ncbi:thioredoxin domain-containing protein [uncultured Agrococcus sp.]|uniref:DsbA family protein n=1 Tax=uncultured Agrococcus sp. TaxID=382258 RepID=UPI0025D6ECBA|nr:thioredoxin domain-containing protein [uncultured Agrococcus sp.]